jgi:hypothetical protein
VATKGKKDFPLSITVKAVDRATGTLDRVNKKLDATFKPFQKLRDQLGDLGKNSGIGKITAGLKGIGDVTKSVAIGFGALTAAGYGAFRVVKGMVDEFDDLGGTASRLGVTVDALAQLRFAAQKSDVEVTELDSAFGAFNKQIGLARVKSGKLYSFLGKASPVLRKQVLATKSSEEAFGLMADAIVKVEDPAKRTALAMSVFGGSGEALIPLLARGSKGIDELRKRHMELAGSQEDAAGAAGQMDDAMIDAQVSLSGVKGAILVGLAPAFTELTERVSKFFSANRGRIAEWARDFGEKLPSRIEKLVEILRSVGEVIGGIGRAIGWLVDKVGGAENAIKLLVGGFLALKAAQMIGHVGSIVAGLGQMTTAATAAAGGMGGLGVGIAKLGASVPILGALALAATSIANAVDRSQTKEQDRQVNKGALGRSLGEFDEKGDDASRRGLVRQLRDQGLLDEKTGLLKGGRKTMDLLRPVEGIGGQFLNQDDASKKEMERINRILRAGPVSGAGITRPMGGTFGPPAPEGHVLVEVKAPPGTTVTKDPKSTGVSTKNSPQLVPQP